MAVPLQSSGLHPERDPRRIGAVRAPARPNPNLRAARAFDGRLGLVGDNERSLMVSAQIDLSIAAVTVIGIAQLPGVARD